MSAYLGAALRKNAKDCGSNFGLDMKLCLRFRFNLKSSSLNFWRDYVGVKPSNPVTCIIVLKPICRLTKDDMIIELNLKQLQIISEITLSNSSYYVKVFKSNVLGQFQAYLYFIFVIFLSNQSSQTATKKQPKPQKSNSLTLVLLFQERRPLTLFSLITFFQCILSVVSVYFK